MLRRINPKAIICYCEPFDEMQGNIITVDYAQTNNLSSNKEFRYLEDNREYKMLPTKMPSSLFEINRQYMVSLNETNVITGFGGGGGRVPMGKGKRNMPRNNQKQNKQFKDVVRKLKLNKQQQRELHELVHGQGMGYQELLEFARSWFNIY